MCYILCSHHKMTSWILIKFIYSEKATKLCEISTLLWLAMHRAKIRWRFRKIFWPSQNIWTLLRKKGVKKNKEVHETKAPSEGPFCQAHNLELLYFCLIAAAAVLGNKKGENARLSAVSLFLVKYLLQTFEALKGPFFVWRNILRFFDDELLFSFCALRQVRALTVWPVW